MRAVIIDWDFNLSMKQLIKAQVYLRNPDCEFLVCGTDMVLLFDVPTLGPGPFYKIIEQFTGRTGTVVAKPGLPFKDIVMRKYVITDPSRVLFIGDSYVFTFNRVILDEYKLFMFPVDLSRILDLAICVGFRRWQC